MIFEGWFPTPLRELRNAHRVQPRRDNSVNDIYSRPFYRLPSDIRCSLERKGREIHVEGTAPAAACVYAVVTRNTVRVFLVPRHRRRKKQSTIKPEHLLEPRLERGLVGGVRLTLLA